MAKTTLSHENLLEEDYIDMEISTATFVSYSRSSPPHSREFEFHMSAPLEREPIASPADELFYKGKLLPLHLPPRLQMVQKLLQSPLHHSQKSSFEFDSISNLSNTAHTTPFESCNASPATSCYVSGELTTEDYFYECSTGIAVTEPIGKKSWSKKLKFIRQLSLGLKIKGPKAYLKSMFNNGNTDKSRGCNEKYSSTGTSSSKSKECSSNGYLKAWKKNPFVQMRRDRCIASSASTNLRKEQDCGHRRSFSSVMTRHSLNKSLSSVSSSCSSSNSSSFSCASSNGSGSAGPVLKRSSSASSEMENPIQGAIAYCKKSQAQHLASVRKSVSDTGFCFATASKVADECGEEMEESAVFRRC